MLILYDFLVKSCIRKKPYPYFKQMANKTDGALRDKFDVVHDLNDKLDRMLKRSDIDQEII